MHIIPKDIFNQRFKNEEFDKVVSVLPLNKEGIWLAGGVCRKLIQGAAFDSDWDFFFKDEVYLQDFQNKVKLNILGDINENEFNNSFTYKRDLSIDDKDNTYK